MYAGQQSIDVTAQNVVPQIDKPQHMCLGTSAHSQQTKEDSYGHKTTEASNAKSSSMPKAEATRQGEISNIYCVKRHIIFLETNHHTPNTDAALKAFDEYFTVMHNCVNPLVFTPKCISYGVFEGSMYASGGAIFLTNQIKMETVLPEIRKLISLNGVVVFERVLKVLRSEPTDIYNELADCMESMHYVCIVVPLC